MGPTIGKPDVRADTVWRGQPVVSGVAVHLQDAGEPLQYPFCMNASSTGSIGEGHTWWSAAAPCTIITGECPKVSRLGLAGAGIKHRSKGLVHEELGRPLQVGNQGIEDGAQFKGCPLPRTTALYSTIKRARVA